MRESREACPCALRLDLREAGAGWLAVWNLDENKLLQTGSLSGEEEDYVLEVPRAEILVQVGDGFTAEEDRSCRIPPGMPCPPVRLFRDTVDVRTSESALVRVSPLRQYCALTLAGSSAADLSVRGGIIGIDAEGTPLPGPFGHTFRLDENASFEATVLLPRQGVPGPPLVLRVRDGDAVSDFDLGAIFDAAGYDWTEADLPPLRLHLDIAGTRVRVGEDPGREREYLPVIL